MPTTPSPSLVKAVVAALLLAFAGQCLWAMRSDTVTHDEFIHLPIGLHSWRTGDLSCGAGTPPLWQMVCSLPAHLAHARLDPRWGLLVKEGGWNAWVFGTRFMLENAQSYDTIFYSGRVMTVLAGVGLCLVTFFWARSILDTRRALWVLLLMAFSPSLIANAHLVTTDVAVTLFMTGAVYSLWRFVRQPSWQRLASTGAVVGLAALVKFSAVVLFPLIPLVLLLRGRGLPALGTGRGNIAPVPRGRFILRCFGLTAACLAVSVVVVSAGYGFRGFGRPLRSLALSHQFSRRLQQSFLGALPLPLPELYVQSLDAQAANMEGGEFPGFLWGRWISQERWYALPAVFLIKEPLGFLALLLLACAVFLVRKKRIAAWEASCLLWVPCTLLASHVFLNHLPARLRYILPVYPSLWIMCGFAFDDSVMRNRCGRGLVYALTCWAVVSPLLVAPHYLAYFNEAVGGARNGYRYLIDSNLDWGQDLKNLKKYLTKNGIGKIQLAYYGHVFPQLYGIDFEPLGETPKPGVVVISASFLQGQPYAIFYLPQPTFPPLDYFRAMRRYVPVDHVGYSLLVYRIPETGGYRTPAGASSGS